MGGKRGGKKKNAAEILAGVDGIIVPGGFDARGVEGKITTCHYARENDIPYLGICLGMQTAVIEYARNVCGLEDANSTEIKEYCLHPVINLMEDQLGITRKGGTMRLGAYPCKIREGTRFRSLYGKDMISERHRHRYEFNNAYRKVMTGQGMAICGASPDDSLVEAIELPDKRFFIGVQFHPEFKSRPNKPHPLFMGLVQAALDSDPQRAI